jgi:hypothetical protein
MKENQGRKIFYHFGLSILLATLIWTLTIIFGKVFPDIGYGILTALYLFILIGQIYYYVLTTYYSIWLSFLSFVLNFILWVAEQVNFEKTFHDSFIYQTKDTGFMVLVLGGLFWTINKIFLDRVIRLFKVKAKSSNRLGKYILRTGIKRTTR